MGKCKSVTAIAPVNIALIKYWGKRDTKLNLPTNGSISVTLESLKGQDSEFELVTSTTVTLQQGGEEEDCPIQQRDVFTLNGETVDIKGRMSKTLEYLRSIEHFGNVSISSNNMFPTAAGLASSASGYAALVCAITGHISGIKPEQASIAARLGSGSACRSLYDGFVLWNAGILVDGTDSIASSIFPPDHWPELYCAILVLSCEEKEVSSADGMQRTVNTSPLYLARLEGLPNRMERMILAIRTKDFTSFAELVMRDSNQFHAVCLDTFPPINYLNEQSFCVINTIHSLNNGPLGVIAAYTFDAGPNAFIFCLKDHASIVIETLTEKVEGAQGKSLKGKIIQCKVGCGAHLV